MTNHARRRKLAEGCRFLDWLRPATDARGLSTASPNGDPKTMSASRRTLLAAALCTALAATAPLAQAADAPITIMVGGINKIIYLLAKLTEALGYFKEEDLVDAAHHDGDRRV